MAPVPRPSVSRREFLAISATTGMACSVGWAAAAEKPNIIFVLADDLGYGDLGCYGQARIQTPNIDRMAREGMRFTQHYAGNTVCAPSRCALMTGLHMGHARIRGNSRLSIGPKDTTVAGALHEAGYRTALIGKWGLGEEASEGVPNAMGFDHFFGYLNQAHAHNYYPEFLWRNGEKVRLRNEVIHAKDRNGKPRLSGAATKRVDYSADLCAKEAVAFIRENRDRPFFLYYATTLPHANNEARLAKRHGMEVPDYGIYARKDWPDPQKGHAAMITRLDAQVGEMLATLKELDLDEKTLVIFTSDNGPHHEGGARPEFFGSGGPLRGTKRDLYEGGIRVPLVARWPGHVRPGTVSDLISAFWDFPATACELAGVPFPTRDGISYLPELTGKPQAKHRYLYWEFGEQGGKLAVRFGKWKAVKLNVRKNPNSPWEVYDLDTDLGEKTNLAAQHPEIAKRADEIVHEAHTDNPNFRILPRSDTAAAQLSRRPPKPPAPDVHLADLQAISLGKPHPTLGPPKLNRSIRNEALKVGGKTFAHGIGVHAPSELTYAKQPDWTRFVAVVGLDDERPTGSVVFQVYADKRKIADTPVMTRGILWHLDVALPADTKQVRLVVTDAGDGTGSDHGDWIDAGFLRK
jgi:uncharacterized sulfatase